MATNPVTLVCWNIENKHASWRLLRTMEADVALLQEARPPPSDVSISAHAINNPGAWPEGRIGKVAVVRLSDRAKVDVHRGIVRDGPVPPRGRASPAATRRGVHRRVDLPGIRVPACCRAWENEERGQLAPSQHLRPVGLHRAAAAAPCACRWRLHGDARPEHIPKPLLERT